MNKWLFILCLSSNVLYSQIGIGTTNPLGVLDINSENLGLLLPRVTSIEVLTDGNGNDPVDGTIVYDSSRDQFCLKVDGTWICTCDFSGVTSFSVERPSYSAISNYVKASNTDEDDGFGAVTMNEDGTLLAVGAVNEDSNTTGINGFQFNNGAATSGAVYVFRRDGSIWSQEAYIKASNTESNDQFGYSLVLSDDGTRLAVGAIGEDSNATGANGNETDNSISSSGAVYIFSRSGTNWSQEAYLKASNPGLADAFGFSVDFSEDASRLAVGAQFERSNATGINGDQLNDTASNSGAVYIFSRSGTTWTQEAYVKASNSGAGDFFGCDVSLNSDSSYLAVGARGEMSNATGINGDQLDNSEIGSGAVYVFSRNGTTWTQQTYIKASNTQAGDLFGFTVNLSGRGNRLAITALNEGSSATGINGDESDNNAAVSGAAYMFSRDGTSWSQEAYIKASNTGSTDRFGTYADISKDGARLIVGAPQEDSNAAGLNGNQNNDSASSSGAAYVFNRCGSAWIQESYIKSSSPETSDFLSFVALSGNGLYVAVGASGEDSNATGINGNQNNNSASNSGAVFIIE